jgi:hypothetical protein
VDSASQIADLVESAPLQQFHSFYASRPHLAERHDLLSGVQLVEAPGQLRERNEVSPYVGNLVLIFFAYIEKKEVFAMIEAAFQVFGLDLGDTHFGFSPFWPIQHKTHLPALLLAVGP